MQCVLVVFGQNFISFPFKPVKWNMRVQLKIIDGQKKLGLNFTYLHFLSIIYFVAFNYCIKLERTHQDYKVVSTYSNRTLKRNMKEISESLLYFVKEKREL